MKKFITIAAMAAFLTVGTNAVSAQTSTADLLAMIATLQAQLNGNTSVSTSGSMLSAYAGVNLKVGSRGTQVSELQACMNAAGYNTGVVDGVFGNNTAAGVKAFQASKGLVADGIVGVKTFPAFQAACPVAVVDEDVDEDVKFDSSNGEEADVKEVDINAEDDADANAKGEKVASFSIELDDRSGAMNVERVDVFMEVTAFPAGEEDDLWDIIENIAIEVDGKEVASEATDDNDDWDDEGSNVYKFRLSGINTVINEDEEVEFDILIDTADLDDDELDITIETTVEVRYTDEAGITDEIDNFGDVSFDVTTDTTDIKVTEADDNPKSASLSGDEDDDLSKVTVFEFDVEAEDGDLELQDLDLNVNIIAGDAGVVADASILVKEAYLYDGSKLIDRGDVDAAGDVTFDLDDMNLDEDEEVTLTVKLDLDNISQASLLNTATEFEVSVTSIEAEDNDGDDVNYTGTLTSENHTYSLDAAMFDIDNSPTLVLSQSIDGVGAGEEDVFEAVFEFSVDAGDEDIYLSNDVADVAFTALDGTTVTVILEAEDDDIEETNSFKINSDSSEKFTLTFTVRGQDTNEKISIDSFGYAFTDVAPTVTLSAGLEDFETRTKYLAK